MLVLFKHVREVVTLDAIRNMGSVLLMECLKNLSMAKIGLEKVMCQEMQALGFLLARLPWTSNSGT